jgi:hypothetical protein
MRFNLEERLEDMNESMRWGYVHDCDQRESMLHDMEISSLFPRCFGGGEAEESNSVSAALNFCSDPIDKKTYEHSKHPTLWVHARKRGQIDK